jgi:hypothetical protein
MKRYPHDPEKSLIALCRLVGIEPERGWKIKLANWFEVDRVILSNWLRRGIPKKQIETVSRKGYPVDRWMVKSPPGSTIYPRDTEGQRITVLREADPGRPSHSDAIGQFKNKALARELNEMLLHIEAADPEMLRRDAGVAGSNPVVPTSKINRLRVKREERHGKFAVRAYYQGCLSQPGTAGIPVQKDRRTCSPRSTS